MFTKFTHFIISLFLFHSFAVAESPSQLVTTSQGTRGTCSAPNSANQPKPANCKVTACDCTGRATGQIPVSCTINNVAGQAPPMGSTCPFSTPKSCQGGPGTANPPSLTVIKNGTGNGTVTSLPDGINCGTSCSAFFASGTVITLSATAAAGSTFTGWSGAGCSGTGACNVTVSAVHTVTATFTSTVAYTLTVSKAGTGMGVVSSSPNVINCGTTCSANLSSGAVVALTATPTTGSTFAGWTGAGCSTSPTCTIVMNSSYTVIANFNSTTAAACNVNTTISYAANSGTKSISFPSCRASTLTLSAAASCAPSLVNGTSPATLFLTQSTVGGTLTANYNFAPVTTTSGLTFFFTGGGNCSINVQIR